MRLRNWSILVVLGACAVPTGACAPAATSSPSAAPAEGWPPPDPFWRGGRVEAPQVARSEQGMVVTAHPLATAAGVAMLESGGNAVDAAVAAAFVLAVVEPSMSGLGGRTQILIRSPGGALHGIDATTQAPADYDDATAPRARHGYPVVGVPGTVAGLLRALEAHGTLSRREVMAPAIRHAREGFRLLPAEAERQASVAELLRESEGARRYFLRADGSPREAGEWWAQTDLARTLRAIADGGWDAFYRGEIAGAIAADMARHGGHVDREALEAYRAEEVSVVRGHYRGYELAGTWVPSYGAITIEALQILDALPVPLAELRGEDWAAAVGQAIRLAYDDRGEQGGAEDARRITSREWAQRKAAEITVPNGWGVGGPRGAFRLPGTGPDRAGALAPGAEAPSRAAAPRVAGAGALEHTTHLSTADGSGMAVALTQSLGPTMGSRVATSGLGFLYAATLGGYLGSLEGGERARSHISPFMVLRDGEPFLVLGAAGGSRIIPAIVCVVSRVIDHGMRLPEAVAAPRVHAAGDELLLETEREIGWSPNVLGRLREAGYEVEGEPETASFGRVHAILLEVETGTWVGVADPDWEGTAAAPERRRR